MQRLAGILLVIGAIAFIVGAIAFIGQTGFFDVEGETAQILAIENHRTPWTIGWVILPVGGVIAALGMLAQAKHFHQTDDRQWVKRWSYGVAIGAFIGSLTYVFNGFFAITTTAERYLELGNTVGGVMFMTYLITTALAIITFGVIFYKRNRKIVGGFLVISIMFLIVTGVIFVPLTNYAPLFIVGIFLAVRPSDEPFTVQMKDLDPVKAV